MFSKRLNLEIDFKIISCAHRSIFSSRNDWGRLPRHGGKICSMIRKYWLENSSLNINYWRQMRSLSCSSCYLPLAPTHSPVKLFWGISLLFMWRVYTTHWLDVYIQAFCHFPTKLCQLPSVMTLNSCWSRLKTPSAEICVCHGLL